MKQILFLRHGKAEPYGFAKPDFDRNLAPRGEKEVEQMASLLQTLGIKPETLFYSPANRTTQTANITANVLQIPQASVLSVDAFYDYVGIAELSELLQTLEPTQSTILLVGHNPWISALASEMAQAFFNNLPTSGLNFILSARNDCDSPNPNSIKPLAG